HPVYVSSQVAEHYGIDEGQQVDVTNRETDEAIEMRVEISDRLVGDLVYIPFHKDQAQLRSDRYLNTITSQSGRCPYTAQTSLKLTEVSLDPVESP
ncbi:MAG: molybdopterin dinucleotide binding domain-containing protein, partial [Myxococcota bacterium]|nr:molybdopterin dinucleotide binding domain-containing protein [Myxococcota bacterium]